MKTIIIMDFSTGRLSFWDLPKEYEETISDYVYNQLNFKESEVSYMVVDKVIVDDYRQW